jgi:hypothetical protein
MQKAPLVGAFLLSAALRGFIRLPPPFKSEQANMTSKSQTQADDGAPKRRLIHSRKQARELLGGISDATLRRLEKAGRLKAIRLSSQRGQAFYTDESLAKLIKEASNG